MENSRIIRERSELPLHTINKEDTISDLIDKLNQNFGLIREYQGGRQGIPGVPGLPGCSNGFNYFDDDLDSDNISGFITSDNNSDSTPCSNYESSLEFNKVGLITNEEASTKIIFTNFTKDTTFYPVYDNLSELKSYPFTSFNDYDSKLTILNSNSTGVGNHITLLNSKAINLNPEFSCKSGFNISNDFQQTVTYNLETLRISGNKNENIQNHLNFIELQDDLTILRKNDSSQKLQFDSSDFVNDFFNRQYLTKQTKNNYAKISDRTGWNAIWQDFYHSEERWDVIPIEYVKITRLKYTVSNSNYITLSSSNGDTIPFTINENESSIRFKQLNNWVLVDFHLKFSNSQSFNTDFKINNLTIDIDTPTVSISTLNWLPGSTYTIYDRDDTTEGFPTPIYFMLNSLTVTNGESFKIDFRCKDIIFYQNQNSSPYFLDGQCWATINSSQITPEICYDNVEICQCVDIPLEMTVTVTEEE